MRIFDLWVHEFGRENILVAPFEKQTIAPDPLTCFFTLTGLPPYILHKLPCGAEKEHVTPPREVTEFFRHMNRSRADFFIRVLAEYLMQAVLLSRIPNISAGRQGKNSSGV